MNLYRTLRSLRDRERGIKPDAAWVRATRATLLMQVKNAMPTAEVAAKHRVPMLSRMYERVMQRVRGPVLAVLSTVSIVLGGSIASVSAAEHALPGDTLYGVKLVAEQARLVFVGSAQKVKLKAAFTKRRVEELKAVIASDNPEKDVRAALATDVLKRDLDTLKQQMTDMQQSEETADTVDAAKEVDKSSVEVSKGLAETKGALSPEVQKSVTDAQQQAADVGIQALEVLVASTADSGENAVSAEDISSSLAAHAEVAAKSVASARVLAGAPPASTTTTSLTITVAAGTASTSTIQLAQDAESALATVQQLAGEQKISQAVDALKDATNKSLTLQKQVQQTILTTAAATSTSMEPPLPTTATSSTPSNVSTTSSTKPVVPSTTSTSTKQ